MFTRRVTAAVLVLIISAMSPLGAVGGSKAAYLGGTISTIKEKSEGTLSTQDQVALTFTTRRESISIPYAAIDALEYGQKAGRRVAVAVLISPLALFSKKRKHYLTVSFKDASGADQAAVFELGKDIVRTTLTVLEVRTHKAIEYQDNDARKSIGGAN